MVWSARNQAGPIVSYHASNRASGQVILTGNNESVTSPSGVFFLEMLQCASGVTLTSGDGKLVIAGITSFSQDQSPLRFDKGLIITGTVVIAKGFLVENCI
jgi:hypothetical protein